MCSLCCLCTYPATPISNRPPAMCGQHEPPVRPAAPRFESRRCDLFQSWGEDEPDSLRYLKVANRSGSEVEGSPARAEAQRSEREKGGDFVPGDSKGRSPWRAFGDFLRDGKVTRGGGAERPPHGGRGGAAPTWEERGAKSDNLLPEGRSPSSHRWELGLPAPHKPPGPTPAL